LVISPPTLITPDETLPARPQAIDWRVMAAVAMGQASRLATAAEEEKLLTHGFEAQPFGTTGRAVGKRGRAPAAAKQMGFARVDLTDFGKRGGIGLGHW
jgi:hypothetical protein